MAELEIKQFNEYNPAEMGNPWVAFMNSNGSYNFNKVISEYTGDLEAGTGGSLIVKNAVAGATYATGQKSRLTKESIIEYYKCTGEAFEQVTKEEFREKIDRNRAAVSQARTDEVKENVQEKLAESRKMNNIVTLTSISAYNTNKQGKPWVTEYTAAGIQVGQNDSLDTKPVGRVVGNPGVYLEVIAINPTPEQVFVVGQKDLDTGKTRMKFYEVDASDQVKTLSRQQVNAKLGIEFQPFQVEDAGKIILDLPNGYDPERYSMWVAKETMQNGQPVMESRDANDEVIGNYSGGREGAPGQFYVVGTPEENAVYAVFSRDMDANKTELVAKVQHINGVMVEKPLWSRDLGTEAKIIKSFDGFDPERFENPYVAKVSGNGKLVSSEGKDEHGRKLYVGLYTGRRGQGELGDVYVRNPQEGDVFAVCQTDNLMLRTQSQFFEYSKGNFIPVERETALELAKQREAEKQAQTPEAAVKEEQKNLREMKEQVEQGKSLSYGQVKQMETYKQRYVAPASAQLMVAEGKDVVLAEIGAYDAKKLKKPYITKRGANGRFSFVSDAAVGEFVGGSEGGKIIVRNVKDGDVFTYGQARNDGEKQASTYAVIQNGQAISMVREEYEGWKAENSGKKNPTERAKQVNLIEATQELAAKGMSGADLQKALLGKENIKEFAGKTAAQKNQLAGNAVKAVETMSQPKSMGR